jgi:membrane-associated phospholipid phosphatase
MEQHRSLEVFSRVVAVMFHPMLLPSLAFLLLTGLDSYLSLRISPVRLQLFFLLLAMTFLVPAMVMVLLKHARFISSFQLEDRKERTLPLVITAIIYYLTFRFFQRSGMPWIYSLMLLSATAMILSAMFINLKWKISLHMLGVGGVFGMFHGLAPLFPHQLFIPSVVVAGLAGLIGFSRLYLKSHKPIEIYTGFIVGYLIFLILFGTLS